MESGESLDKERASGFRRRKFILLEPTFVPFLLCEGIDVRFYFVLCEDMCAVWVHVWRSEPLCFCIYKVMGSLGWCRKLSTH